MNIPVMERDPPSVVAIKSYLANKPRNLKRVMETFATRGILLTIGFALLDNPKTALKNGALGSLIIETYLLYFYSSPRFYDRENTKSMNKLTGD
jgi:hypothetical protein